VYSASADLPPPRRRSCSSATSGRCAAHALDHPVPELEVDLVSAALAPAFETEADGVRFGQARLELLELRLRHAELAADAQQGLARRALGAHAEDHALVLHASRAELERLLEAEADAERAHQAEHVPRAGRGVGVRRSALGAAGRRGVRIAGEVRERGGELLREQRA